MLGSNRLCPKPQAETRLDPCSQQAHAHKSHINTHVNTYRTVVTQMTDQTLRVLTWTQTDQPTINTVSLFYSLTPLFFHTFLPRFFKQLPFLTFASFSDYSILSLEQSQTLFLLPQCIPYSTDVLENTQAGYLDSLFCPCLSKLCQRWCGTHIVDVPKSFYHITYKIR